MNILSSNINKAKRVPICFCVDVSRSMDEVIEGLEYAVKLDEITFEDQYCYRQVNTDDPRCKTKMDKIVEGLNNFYKAILDDDVACDSCESVIVTFNDNVEVLDEFDTIDNKQMPKFPQPKGNTNMSIAIRKALDLISERQQIYKDNAIKSGIPWLVLFTDGQPTDDTSLIKQELKQMQLDKKLMVYTMALSDSDELVRYLKSFSENPPIECKDPKEIQKFFTFLAKSVSVGSTNNGIPKDFWS